MSRSRFATHQGGGEPRPRGAAILRWLLLPWYLASVFTAAKSFGDNPVIGNRLLNRWGLHLVRRRIAARAGAYRRRRLATRVTAADRVALERDGFVMRRDFLDTPTFESMRRELLALFTPAREAVIGDTLTRLIPLDACTLPGLPVTRGVLESPAYRNLLAYVGSFERRPRMYVQTVFSRYCEGERDIQSYFHSDTFHPTLKSWLLLEDVTEEDAPLLYVPGSHRGTPRRLAWERRMSEGAARANDRLTSEGSLRISEPEIERLGYGPPRCLACPANTLIVADTSGFHARSVPARASVRVSIWAYSRSNPFLPWVWGDLESLPLIKGRSLRIAWTITDELARWNRRRPVWRFVGARSPLAPP